ncbi:hypothetical protein GCM10011613_07700 [Cellvibrio zantedeschiae]|uniref:Glycosyl hydrolase family 98 putative carbohydrate-binding module domain-containing protein n=1 Tax=Cellvibrio zantedeschiae TaxID=1237077 RepID=A0ABQ3ATF2_9GAMM|nr:NPCBM/NEW2 domain-containing protein [Cellvibrio zantedeschiae]GGY66248.1 hypothetical protein GCM10011613_07700 [Cellvibrio zantedeschiae]
MNSADEGAALVQTDCSQFRANWEVNPLSGSDYQIVSQDNNWCIGRSNLGSDTLTMTNCMQASANLWRFNLASKMDLLSSETRNGIYEIRSSGEKSKCLSLSTKSSVAEINTKQAECVRDSGQRWMLVGKLPDTAAKTELNLLVIAKPESKIPGMPERKTSTSARQKQRFWSETALPRFFHDYTNGRVKLNVYYYESPYVLTSFVDGGAVTPPDIPEDMDIILNAGWFDGILINHSAPIGGGLVTFAVSMNGFNGAFSNVPIDDSSPLFFGNDMAQLGGSVHEFMHQLDYYFEQPGLGYLRKITQLCTPTGAGMLDCGADEPIVGNYRDNTDNLGTWLAFYRDYLNGFLWSGTAGFGEPVWANSFKIRNRNSPAIPGGPFGGFSSRSTCLNLTTPLAKFAYDTSTNRNHGIINNANQSNTWSGSGFIFDGIDDYLKISNLVGDDFTISFWIKSDQVFSEGTPEGVGLVYAGADNGSGFELRGVRTSAGPDSLKFTVGNVSVQSSSDVTTNTWKHIAVVRSKTNGTTLIYVNGILEGSVSTGNVRLNGNPIIKIGSAFPFPNRIGYTSSYNDHFKGEMTDFCVSNTAMSNQEVATLATGRNIHSGPGTIYLSDMAMKSWTNGWGPIGIDKSTSGGTLSLDEKTYAKGLGPHAPSTIVYQVNGMAKRFTSDIGIDDNAKEHLSSAEFLVYGDGKLLYRSGDKYDNDPVVTVDLDISDVIELKLVTTEGQTNGTYADHTDWADAKVTLK